MLLFIVVTNKEQSHHRIMGRLVAESLTKDSLFAAIQQRLSGMSNIIDWIQLVTGLYLCNCPGKGTSKQTFVEGRL
jgi:hypothetical protein